MTERLGKQEWINAGLEALKKSGARALKAEPLAKGLGVSRGSFYWHFESKEDFEVLIVKEWRLRSTQTVIVEIDKIPDPKKQLSELIDLAMSNNMALDKAIRAWATHNVIVAKTVAQVDKERIRYVESLLQNAGVSKIDVHLRAKMIYWSSLGRQIAISSARPSLSKVELDKLIELILS